MAPVLSPDQEKQLNDLVYKEKNYRGRDALFNIVKQRELKISRRQIMDFLKKQEFYQLHKAPPKRKGFQGNEVHSPGKYFQMDLFDMSSYKDYGYVFVLCLIDVYSRKAYTRPIKNKSDKVVIKALNYILDTNELEPTIIQSDNGLEFKNGNMSEFMKEKSIKQLYSKAHAPYTNGRIEKFNDTIKRYIFKGFTVNNNKRWVKSLQQYTDNYNNTSHRITKETPDERQEKFEPHTSPKGVAIAEGQSQSKKEVIEPQEERLDNYQNVRLRLNKGKLDKSQKATYSKEIYKVVSSKKYKGKYRYKISLNNEVLRNSYSLEDLLSTQEQRIIPRNK